MSEQLDLEVEALRAQLAAALKQRDEALGLSIRATERADRVNAEVGATLDRLQAAHAERDAALAREAVLREAAANFDVFNTLRRHNLYSHPAYTELAERYEAALKPALLEPSTAATALLDRVRRGALEKAAKVVDDLDMPDMWDGSIGRTDDGGAFRSNAVAAIRALADKATGNG